MDASVRFAQREESAGPEAAGFTREIWSSFGFLLQLHPSLSPSPPSYSSTMGKSDKKTKTTTSDVPVAVVAAPPAVKEKTEKKQKKAVSEAQPQPVASIVACVS